MKSLSLAKKLLIPNLILLAFLLTALGYLLVVGTKERNRLLQTVDRIKHQNNWLYQLNFLRREKEWALLSFRFEKNPVSIEKIRSTERKSSLVLEELFTWAHSEREQRLLAALVTTHKQEQEFQEQLFAATSEKEGKPLALAFRRWNVQTRKFGALIADLTTYHLKALDRAILLMDQEREDAAFVLGALLICSASLVAFFGFFISRYLVTPLGEITHAAKLIAQGNFAARVRSVTQKDELGELGRVFNEMVNNLNSAKSQLEAKIKELHRSNTELQQFAYVSSHDLKEPLRMVSLYVQLLENEHSQSLPNDARQYLDYIVEAGKRMQELIDDLLTYSSIGRVDNTVETVDIGDVLKTCLGDLRAKIEESHAEIEIAPMPVLEGSRVQLIQVFENLLSNAIKFRGAKTPQIRVSATESPTHWQFEVADNGIGIKSRYWEKIFVIFQRLHPRTEYPGTGIGLAICHKIIERHAGRIWLESREGQGTTFHFTVAKNPTPAVDPRSLHA